MLPDRATWIKYFEFLDTLRESGITNMFASTPHLEKEFNLSTADAKAVLKTWMNTLGERDDSVEERVNKIT